MVWIPNRLRGRRAAFRTSLQAAEASPARCPRVGDIRRQALDRPAELAGQEGLILTDLFPVVRGYVVELGLRDATRREQLVELVDMRALALHAVMLRVGQPARATDLELQALERANGDVQERQARPVPDGWRGRRRRNEVIALMDVVVRVVRCE